MHVASSLVRRARLRALVCSALCLMLWAALPGCNKLREHAKPETVYVVAKQTYLRDRVAAVSNRIALVTNGQALEVVEHGRRFLKVKTSKGEVGWIEDHMVIDQAAYDQFPALAQQHKNDPVVATGVLRDHLYLHAKPGRDTSRFYLLPENEKLQLLLRASVPKPAPPAGVLPVAKPAKTKKVTLLPGEPEVPMEDWWLVRDGRGQVGWILARRLDVDVPDEIAGYSEGQKMVGAYVLTKVHDDESTLPGNMVPEFVSLTNAFKDGLPYDFNAIRVFTWNTKKHRYETAYRQRDIEGVLPLTIGITTNAQGQTLPTFTVTLATSDAVKVDPLTGATRPQDTEQVTYQLEAGMVHRVAQQGEPGAKPLQTKKPAAAAAPHRHHHGRTAQ